MQEDIFDIVDENDRVVGQAPRSEAHAKKLRHRAVHVLVFNKEGEIFMQKRCKTKDTWPGAWDSSCSGHVDSGEDYLEAALRELEEELGYQPKQELELLFKLLPSEETGQEFINVYRVTGSGPFRLNHDEIEIGEWMNVPNLLERVEYTPKRFTSAFRLVLTRLQALQLIPSA
ncbi:NUDIX domain-containing protein [Pelagicoccus sp. SDUM812003]|uniref:NUDIX hydrolase n=1 Tax=Pelagicoccus sp. SDUM812003 TaxID=3041267 RepID=UPI0028101B06|nr:NUDIX domain-containing protein [Pelagicoccus sp. SDUM812003]MDQ8202023.1 NUDIX domain-containing protein [Pelagicoccus sp. SDUM812003]